MQCGRKSYTGDFGDLSTSLATPVHRAAGGPEAQPIMAIAQHLPRLRMLPSALEPIDIVAILAASAIECASAAGGNIVVACS